MNDNIERIKEFLSQESSVLIAYLFGSRLKGTANKKSDWDIGIYFTQESLDSNPWHDFIIGAKLSLMLKSEVEVITLNKPSFPLLGFEIIGRGKLLVSKDEDLRLDLENRLSRNYYDWNYFFKRNLTQQKI